MNTEPHAISDSLYAMHQIRFYFYTRGGGNNVYLITPQNRYFSLRQNAQMAEVMRMLQQCDASRNMYFFGV
jgi:hypothetical protein